jgi:hypothetical protein
VPVTIAIHTASSDSTAAQASRSSRTICGLTAFSLSGRLSVIVAIRSSTS